MIIEYILGAVFVVLAILTLVNPEWIEAIFKVDPDRGSGALEWFIVAIFGVLAVVAAALGTKDAIAMRRRAA
ncbi:hypothetical protein [Agromyces sp. Soil535]|uniref:hypothetical protein n=1 Tax=Agromyces sp. Soil535 TaxID=1736390 RepID=UPI001910BD6D|nr:hypothetical protein [Agromyces sp. Soil535]